MENRIPPPVLTLALASIMWFARSSETGSLSQGLIALGVFLVAGIVGFPAIAAFNRAGTTIHPVAIDQASKLVTTGIYGLSRNPMYVSLATLLVAWAIGLGGAWLWLGPVFLVLWIDPFQIRPEERAMAARFGEDYLQYKSRVRRWL